jgi:hypothetical protein
MRLKKKHISIIVLTLIMLLTTGVVTAQAGDCCVCNQGCTPGYWKNHTDSWVGYTPGTYFDDVFGVGPHVTLLDALNTGGGWKNDGKPLRHGTAALLNAAHGGVGYAKSESQVIAMVQAWFNDGRKGPIKRLVRLNERYCPLD